MQNALGKEDIMIINKKIILFFHYQKMITDTITQGFTTLNPWLNHEWGNKKEQEITRAFGFFTK